MAKKFSELQAQMRPDAQRQVQAKTAALQTTIKLRELRKSLCITQASLARNLRVQQAAISKMESRDDLLLSSLIEFVRGLGGHLVLTASFPDDRTFDLTPQAALPRSAEPARRKSRKPAAANHPTSATRRP
ncbi:helix-turn-helix domain-containing protein [Herbaspirillum seropedicae]|uniref:helix-turn-helix domain-containing protein n=1 Tax=Herbaspirillum seropedicae TaxID=964 RepID=UPI0015DFA288|nr:helix-turn-helix transcriptional regulator [Herbaspirillum seropedicae]